MRRRILALLSVMAVALVVVPATASAATGLPPDTEPAMFPAGNGTTVPAGFRIDPDQAVAIAKTAPKMIAIHRAHHPLDIRPYVWIGSHYEIYFYYQDKVIADQIVGRDGAVGPTYTGALILGIYARGHYGGIFDSPLVLVPFTLMFLLPLLLLRRASWFDRFDVAAVLTFGISYALFDTLHLEAGVWLFYPPLLYLLVRMLIRGARSRSRGEGIDCRLPTAVLAVGLLALVVARIDVTLHPFAPIDVADASVIGAYKLLHGQSLYYPSLGHGDTYGPIAYLAYAPFELIWPGGWPYLPAARAAAITFDLLTIAGLILLGLRLRARRRDGWRLGLLLAWLWAACPFSLLGMEKSTNDGLVALIVVLIMLALESPIKRGVLVGLGTASKFFPAILLPLVAVGRGDSDQRTIRKVLAAFVITTGVSIAVFLPPGGLTEFWDHTIGYQLTRTDIFSIWALHPALAPIKVALEAAAAFLAVFVAFRPRGLRTPAQVAALGAAVIIAVQLPALHWFYLYIVWFLPLVLVAVLGAGAPHASDIDELDRSAELKPEEPGDASPAFAGAV
jgi:Glycosyltransferase family 87